MAALSSCLVIEDLQRIARRRVPKVFYDYVDSGSYTESTYRNNTSSFDAIRLRQRVAVNLENRNLGVSIQGSPAALPIAIAPMGSLGLQSPDGEIKAARAAERIGVPFVLSTMSICSIEDVAANTSKPFWFQLYVMRDRKFVERLIDRARAAGCPVLVLTMDLQVNGQRHKDMRNQLTAPPTLTPRFVYDLATKPAWSFGMLGAKRRVFGNVIGHVTEPIDMSGLFEWSRSQFDLTLSWSDIGWIKKRFGGPVVVKGVLDPEDAQLALDNGADGIIVSNHGGRQLDGAPPTIEVLPQIVDRVGHRTEVYLDSGIRSGQHVIKALALGAKAVFMGRAVAFGMGAGGQAGVERAFEIVGKELDTTMALMGYRDVRDLGPDCLYRPVP